jgi:hypothetical protein
MSDIGPEIVSFMEEIRNTYENPQPDNHALDMCSADNRNLLLQPGLPAVDQPVVQFDNGRPPHP